VADIEKNEEVLNKLYADAGVKRVARPFRFPYGDKGGEKKDALQAWLREKGFNKVKDDKIPYAWWKEQGLDRDIDTLWTFDFMEYMIRPDSEFTEKDVQARMHDKAPKEGAVLFEDGGRHILLIHAHDETEELVPGYYRLFLDELLEKGVVFDKPEFFE
jgi:hypothetical protein